MRDSELNMLAFFIIRGVDVNKIINSSSLVKKFYYHAMEMYYKERDEILTILLKVLGGG